MKKIIYVSLSFAPMLALAQSVATTQSSLTGLLTAAKTVLNALIPVLLALAVIYFFWGLLQFIRSAGDQKARDEGKSKMIWGLVAIVIFVSLFGIIAWLQNATGLTNGGTIQAPQIP